MPNALTVLHDVIKDKSLLPIEKKILIEKFDTVFSLDLFRIDTKETVLSDTDIQSYIVRRKEARASKNWARADEIRDELAQKGIELVDTPDGTTWKVIS